MAESTIKAQFDCSIEKLWKIVTSVQDYSWRSDLSKVEIINEKEFIEYTKNNYPTSFVITKVKPFLRWEFLMENSNMKGSWIGQFIKLGEDKTEVKFTEEVYSKKIILRPFVKLYLKKQQRRFIADLRDVLELR